MPLLPEWYTSDRFAPIPRAEDWPEPRRVNWPFLAGPPALANPARLMMMVEAIRVFNVRVMDRISLVAAMCRGFGRSDGAVSGGLTAQGPSV